MALAEFLQASSIHGLRYLSEAKGWLGRLVWLVLILTSFSTAIIISYANVINWQNSPVTITKASTVMLKDENVSMPTITVCPKRPDYNAFIVNYLNRYYDKAERLRLRNNIKGEMAFYAPKEKESRAAAAVPDKLTRALAKDNPCKKTHHGNGTLGNNCEIIMLLYAIRDGNLKNTTKNRNCILVFRVDMIKVYVFIWGINRMGTDFQPTNEGLEKFLEDYFGCAIVDKTSLPKAKFDYADIFKLYGRMFPLYNKRGLLAVPKNLDDLNFEEIAGQLSHNFEVVDEMLASGHAGDLVGQMHLEKVSNTVGYAVQDFVLLDIADRIGIPKDDKEGAFTDVARIINAFTYGSKMLEDKTKLNCTVATGTDPCGNIDKNAPAECQEYCELVEKGREAQDFILELLELSMPSANSPQELETRRLLPGCNWAEDNGECWARVNTDQGVCFSNVFKDLPPKSANLGNLDPRDFLLQVQTTTNTLDYSDIFYMGKSQLDSVSVSFFYDLMVTPKGQLALGKTAVRKESVVVLDASYDKYRYNNVRIVPSLMVKGTSDFGSMSVVQRNCLYPNEKGLEHFGEYNQANCILECAWDRALDRCGCVPWFLRQQHPGRTVCEHFGNACFKKVVDGRYDDNDSDRCHEGCLNDCETLEFVVSAESNGEAFFPLSDYCSVGEDMTLWDESESQKAALCEGYENNIVRGSNGTSRIREAVKMLRTKMEMEFDWGNMDKIQLTTLYFGKVSVLKVLESSTMTLVDMISNIGGTLGLFCGFSVLSAIEIVYWAWKLGHRQVDERRKRPRKVAK